MAGGSDEFLPRDALLSLALAKTVPRQQVEHDCSNLPVGVRGADAVAARSAAQVQDQPALRQIALTCEAPPGPHADAVGGLVERTRLVHAVSLVHPEHAGRVRAAQGVRTMP